MGIICSQSLDKVGNTIFPTDSPIRNQSTVRNGEHSSRDTTDNIRIVKPAPNIHPIVALTSAKPPTNRSISTKSSPKVSNETPSTSTDASIFTDRFQTPYRTTSSIDTNSILFRGNDVPQSKAVKPIAFNHTKSKSPKKTIVAPFEAPHKIIDIESPRSPSKSATNLSKVQRRFGGSFQTLLNPSSSGKSSAHSLSASENNLSSLSGKHKQLTSKRFSTNSDYCPSVLFNRIANKRNEERNLTLTRWKNYFMVNILRRKKDFNSRKT